MNEALRTLESIPVKIDSRGPACHKVTAHDGGWGPGRTNEQHQTNCGDTTMKTVHTQNIIAIAAIAVFALASCSTPAPTPTPTPTPTHRDLAARKAEQAALTPAQVMESLRLGNERFASGKPSPHDMLDDRQMTAEGQYPHAIILSCIDSRVPAETIFDAGLGDLFSERIAGNIADEDVVGSLEYACEESGARLVLVMGHTSCGAIKGACDHVELGNLTGLLKKIEPAIASVSDVPGERNSKNKAFVQAVCEANVRLTLTRIRELSPTLRGLEEEGKIQIAGCIYDLDSGRVRFFPQNRP
jgi:carbonic anhydrase